MKYIDKTSAQQLECVALGIFMVVIAAREGVYQAPGAGCPEDIANRAAGLAAAFMDEFTKIIQRKDQ